MWCWIAFQDDRLAQLARGLPDLSDELEPVAHVTQWRHEDMQIAVTRLERHRGAHEALPVMPGIGDPCSLSPCALKLSAGAPPATWHCGRRRRPDRCQAERLWVRTDPLCTASGVTRAFPNQCIQRQTQSIGESPGSRNILPAAERPRVLIQRSASVSQPTGNA